MATAGDSPPGFFPRVWYRLHAAASGWRRRREASGNDAIEEATVRARLVRRAAAARRVTRKLAFLSFNIEVLVFVYTFWRARRRNLSWRQPIQALLMLVVPALATLIYAAFIRFTRTLDHNDNKMLERRQEEKQETEGEPGEFDKKGRDSVQNCNDMDGANHSLVAADSMAHNSKVRKRQQSSIKLRDDGGGDTSWGHSKDFEPIPSDGLRKRRFSSGETYTANISVTESSEEETQKTTSVSLHSNQHGWAPIYTEDVVSYPFDDCQHSRPVISSMLAEPANVHQELPAGDGEEERFDGLWCTVDTHSSSTTDNHISPVVSDHSFCDRDNSSLSEHGVSSLSTVFQELLVQASEERSLYLPEKLEFSPIFMKEAPASTPEYVAHSSFNDLSSNPSDPVLPASETFEKFHAEDFMEEALLESHKPAALQTHSFILEDIPTPCTIDDSGVIVNDEESHQMTSICSSIHSNEAILDIDTVTPKLSLIPQLLGERVEKDSSKLHALEGNITFLNLEEEVSVFSLAANNTEHRVETPVSLCSHKTDEMDAAESVSFIKASPEWSLLSSPELVAEGGEEASEKEMPVLNTKEHDDSLINLEEKALQVEPVVSPTEQCFEISELSLCSQDAKVIEVPGIIYLRTVTPESNYLASPELLVEDEEDSKEDGTLDLHLHEQKGLPFNLEMKPFVDPLIVDTAEDSLVTPEFLLCKEEVQMTEYEGVAQEVLSESEGAFNYGKLAVTFANDESNTQNLISNFMSAQFISDTNIKEVHQVSEEASEKETSVLNTQEDNASLINLEEKALQVEPVVSPTEQCFEISELSHCGQDAMVMEVPGIVSLPTVTPESNYLASPELLVEDEEDSKEDGTLDLHLHEQKGLPFNLEMKLFVDPLIVNTAEYSLVTPEFLLCKEEVQMTEYEGVAQEVLSESEGSFNHGKLAVTFANDEINTQNLISNLMSAQFISDTNIKEALQVGQETLSQPPHESTCLSEGIFISSGEINNDELDVPAPFTSQRGFSNIEDEITITSLDNAILLDEVRSAENRTDSSGSSPCIQDGKQAPSETSKEVTFHLEESLMSSDEGVKSEIFSLYSRSSSCVSEINTKETLKGGTSSEPESDRGFSSDEQNPVIFHYMNSPESYTNNPMSAEFVLEDNMMEAINVSEEETGGLQHEVSSTLPGAFVTPDVSNGMGQSDEHLDLLSFSFAPAVDAFEPLQTGEGFSELQRENDFTFQETDVSPKEVNNAEDYFTNTTVDPQDDEKTATVALQPAQQRLAEYQYEDVFTLDRTYVSPENTSVAESSFSADHASDFPIMVESHNISEKTSPISQGPLNLEDILVYPDDGSKTENDLDNAKLSLCSTDVNLTEPLGNYQERTPQQQDETMLGCDDIYMSLEEPTSENHFKNSGSQDIPDSIMIETLQGTDRSPSKILHDVVIFSPKGMTSLSLDGGDDAEISCINPDSVMHPLFEPKYEKQKVDFEETSNFSSASSRNGISFVVTPQELPADPGSEKSEFSLKDKKPKDGESEDMKDDVEDLDDDNENGPIDVSVDKIPTVVVPKPSVEMYAEDASWRESAMGQSNDFEVFE